MTHLQATRNDIKARLETTASRNQAAGEGNYAEYRRNVEALSAQYKAALLAGDGEAAEQARRAGIELINQYHGI